MKYRLMSGLGTVIVGLWMLVSSGTALADPVPSPGQPPQTQTPIVRIAELQIDPYYIEQYKAALTEEINASISVEPGVLSLNAVSIKDEPTHIRIFETYADMDAYHSHIQSPHFLKYKTETQHMIRNLTLLQTDPIFLGTRPA